MSLATDALEFIHKYPGIGGVLGGICGALITSLAIIGVAEHYTKRMKKTDATFEFSKRFHDLMADRTTLNNEYNKIKKADPNSEELSNEEVANAWWLRFFDLMLFEFHFFKDGLLVRERFVEWMKWRRREFLGDGQHFTTTWGVDYRQGWNWYKNISDGQDNPLIYFLDEVHKAEDFKKVERIVKTEASRWWPRSELKRLFKCDGSPPL